MGLTPRMRWRSVFPGIADGHTYCLRGAFCGCDRYAHHWYDLDRLQAVRITSRALVNKALAPDVAKHKQFFFAKPITLGWR